MSITTVDGEQERKHLLDTVVAGGYCVGCGACAAVEGSGLTMGLNGDGQYEPAVTGPAQASGLQRVCPFSNQASNETAIAQWLFGSYATWHDKLGYHLSCYAGFVQEGEFRDHGSSGGLGKWIGYELMRKGLVDAVVQVVAQPPSNSDGVLYRYAVTRDLEATKHASRSVYYPVELSEVVREMKEHEGRYAVVGVPCFIKALRLLAARDSVLAERLGFTVGLVCGHLKSTFYAEMLAWQDGIEPGALRGVDFRKKYPGATAKQKGMEFTRIQDAREVRTGDIVQKYFGTDYSLGLFKYNACDYCDDVVAETADVVVGDAWLPEYVEDGQGTNVLIVRRREVQDLIDEARAEGRLALDVLDTEAVVQSQAGGFRHRRDGLAYRLQLKDEAGDWRPTKRVAATADHLSLEAKHKFLLRLDLAEEGPGVYREARRRGSFAYFQQRIERITRDHRNGDAYWPRFVRPLRRLLRFGRRARGGVARRVRRLPFVPSTSQQPISRSSQ